MRRIVVSLMVLALAAAPARTVADQTGQKRRSPWSGQVGAGVDVWLVVPAANLRGAIMHDDVPVWLDLRLAWAPTAQFGTVELGAENRFAPAARISPIWTARWGLLVDSAAGNLLTGVFVTSGIGISWRATQRFSIQASTELTASPRFDLPLPRLHLLANFHFP